MDIQAGIRHHNKPNNLVMRSREAATTHVSKYKILKMLDCLARNTMKSAQLNIDDDPSQRLHNRTARFAAAFSAADESVLPSEVRSKSAYYSVVASAVAKLPNNTRESRQALYDRAEIALAAELLQDPQVSDQRAAVERLAFERAIRKIEGDARKKEKPKQFQERQRGAFTSFLYFLRVAKRQI